MRGAPGTWSQLACPAAHSWRTTDSPLESVFFVFVFFVFNRQGLDSGFGGDDDIYNVYDKAWRREGSTANAIYRPSKNVDRDVYGDDLEKLVETNR